MKTQPCCFFLVLVITIGYCGTVELCVNQSNGFHCTTSRQSSVFCESQKISQCSLYFNCDSNPTNCEGFGCNPDTGKCNNSTPSSFLFYMFVVSFCLIGFIVLACCFGWTSAYCSDQFSPKENANENPATNNLVSVDINY